MRYCRPRWAFRWRTVDCCRRVRVNLSIYPSYAKLRSDSGRSRSIGELFGIPPEQHTWAAVSAAIDAYTEACRLPHLAPLFEPGTNGISELVRHPFKDPRFAVAVLAKSTSKVFLANRPPLLSAVRTDRDVVLALPVGWKK